MNRHRRIALLLGVVATGGAGTMVVELAAVRLLAPWFGTSQVVWANVIAVILFALAFGYALGGRLSGGGRDLVYLGRLLLLAAFATAWLPALSGPVAEWFLPAELALHEAAQTVLWGSLAASLVLFFPPAAILGCVSPLAVEAVAGASRRGAGAAGGLVLAASTLGSLAGVFATTLTLIPELGLSWTFRVAAVVLFAAGVAALLLDKESRARGAPLSLFLCLVAGAGAGVSGTLPQHGPVLPAGSTLLAHRESPYQSIRIVERKEGGQTLRFLQVNEGFDSYQSVWQPEPGLLPIGYYYNDVLLPAAWSRALDETRAARSWRVLVQGLGGGTTLRVLEGGLDAGTELDFVGVELDPEVVELAEDFLGLPAVGTPRRRILAGIDARFALRIDALAEDGFDQIFLDCYANQVEIPSHLVTKEFLRESAAHLRPGGWLQMNLGGFGFDDPVVSAIAHTTADALDCDVLLLRVPFARNITLLARPDAELPLGGDGLVAVQGDAGRLLEARALPGSWTVVHGGGEGPVLTDDHAPIERLQERSLEEGAERLLEAAALADWGRGT